MKQKSIDIYFSDFFQISEDKLERYGAFNISLVTDLPLFIDPFLLFNSRRRKYKALHKQIIRYLRFLQGKSTGTEISAGRGVNIESKQQTCDSTSTFSDSFQLQPLPKELQDETNILSHLDNYSNYLNKWS